MKYIIQNCPDQLSVRKDALTKNLLSDDSASAITCGRGAFLSPFLRSASAANAVGVRVQSNEPTATGTVALRSHLTTNGVLLPLNSVAASLAKQTHVTGSLCSLWRSMRTASVPSPSAVANCSWSAQFLRSLPTLSR